MLRGPGPTPAEASSPDKSISGSPINDIELSLATEGEKKLLVLITGQKAGPKTANGTFYISFRGTADVMVNGDVVLDILEIQQCCKDP